MRNFGNFMHKQQVETQKVLMENYKKMNPFKPTESYMDSMVTYFSIVKNMTYKELMDFAKSEGVKIPCPTNY